MVGIGVTGDKWAPHSRGWGSVDDVSSVPSPYISGSALKQGDGDKLPNNL